MRRIVISAILITAPFVMAQHGTAPSGRYPMGYLGDIWTGQVISTNDETREITLVYRKGEKEETFTGVLRDGYKVRMKEGNEHLLRPSDLPGGTRLTVFYMPKSKKVEGKKVSYFEIFKILFHPREDKP